MLNPDWPVKTLGEIGAVKGGKRLPKGTPWSVTATSHPYIRATDIRDGQIRTEGLVYVPDKIWPVISRYIVEEGDVLITIAGTIGSVAEVPRELSRANLTENAAKVTSLQGLIPAYLSYFLRSPDVREQFENLATTTTQAKLALFRIETIQLSVPPLEEQKRIVALLDAATARVTELTACYEQVRTHANNLFTSALRELMDDPDDTVAMTLADICIVDWGNTNLTKKSYLENGDYLAVSATGPDGRIGHAEHKAFTPVLSAIGARCGRMFLPEEDFTAIKNTITLTPKSEAASGKYIYFLFEHLSLPIRGAAQPFIAKGDIEKFEVAIPPLGRQEKIVQRLELVRAKTSEMVAAYDAKLQAAKDLRQSVLEAAFAGEL
jgi:type I restriction enzyme S subunit